MNQRHTLDARGRALVSVAIAMCFRNRIAITAELSKASQGPAYPRGIFQALALDDLVEWTRAGWVLTGHGKNALIIAGVDLPEGL